MLKNLKEISKDTLIYGFGQGLNGLVSFMMLPVYSSYLTPSDYGILSMFEVLRVLATMLIGFGIASALFRYYYYSSDPQSRRDVVSTAFWMLVFLSAVIMAVVLPLKRPIARMLVDRAEYDGFVVLTILTCILFNMVSFQMYMSRVRRKPINFLIVQIVMTVLKLGLNILFVVYLKMNFAGVVYGNFLSTLLVSGAFILVWVPRNITFALSPLFLKKLLFFCVPILLTNLIFYIQNSFDRFLIKGYLDMAENGLYSFGNKVGSIVFISLIAAFKTAWPPYAMSISKKEDCRQVYAAILTGFAALTVLSSSVLGILSQDLVRILGHGRYNPAATVVFLIAGGYLFRGLEYGISIGIDLAEKTYLSTIVELSAAAVSLCLNILLIPRIGIRGAGIAFCMSNALLCCLMLFISQKNYYVPYPYLRFIVLAGAGVAAVQLLNGSPLGLKMAGILGLSFITIGVTVPRKTAWVFQKIGVMMGIHH